MKWFAQGERQAWIKAHRVYLLFQHTHFQKGHLEMMLNVQIRDIDPNSVVLVTICLTLTSQVSKPWLPEADLPVVMRSRRWLESGLLCVLGLQFSQRLAKLDHCRHCSEEEPDCWGRRSSVTWHGQTIPLVPGIQLSEITPFLLTQAYLPEAAFVASWLHPSAIQTQLPFREQCSSDSHASRSQVSVGGSRKMEPIQLAEASVSATPSTQPWRGLWGHRSTNPLPSHWSKWTSKSRRDRPKTGNHWDRVQKTFGF